MGRRTNSWAIWANKKMNRQTPNQKAYRQLGGHGDIQAAEQTDGQTNSWTDRRQTDRVKDGHADMKIDGRKDR